jgi:hypothetical protein
MQKYTEYNDDRVKQLMELSKKEFPHISEYMIFLMSVDYHCRDEVGMDIPEDEELIKRYQKKKSKLIYIMSRYSKTKKNIY